MHICEFSSGCPRKAFPSGQPIAFNTYQALYDRFGFPIKVETMYNALEKFKSEVK